MEIFIGIEVQDADLLFNAICIPHTECDIVFNNNWKFCPVCGKPIFYNYYNRITKSHNSNSIDKFIKFKVTDIIQLRRYNIVENDKSKLLCRFGIFKSELISLDMYTYDYMISEIKKEYEKYIGFSSVYNIKIIPINDSDIQFNTYL